MGEGRLEDLEGRLAEARRAARDAEATVSRWSRVRLGLFLAAVLCAFGGLYFEASALYVAALAPLLLFFGAVAAHGRPRAALRLARIETDLLAEKIDRIAGASSEPAHGHRILEAPSHPLEAGLRSGDDALAGFEVGSLLAKDLDLVEGPTTLRDVLDTTQTSFGFRRLHACLLRPLTDGESIRRRQDAVRELAGRPTLRWEAARLFHPLRRRSLDFLAEFLAEPPGGVASRALEPLYAIAAFLPGLAIAGAALGLVPEPVVLPFLALTAGITTIHAKRVTLLRRSVYALEPWTAAMERFCRLVGRDAPASPLLAELAEELSEGVLGDRAARWGVLRRRIALLHLGDFGLLSFLWNALTLWDVRLACRIERGFKEHRDRILAEASALGEWEMLAAFATLLEERGDYVFPEILPAPERCRLRIAGGRHPYLEPRRVVGNDVDLGPGRNLLVVTGSNMAGKSTYLKMVALNVILAQIGAPVRADRMEWTPLRLFTVIDVEDDLVRGLSYFRVEVDRVREVLGFSSHTDRVLAVFDELFRGTNSTERVAAGYEILKTLASTGGLFLMATHDMEYTRLPEEIPEARNAHFAEEVDEGGIRFGYRLQDGPSRVRNALRVLETCGIPGEIVGRARRRIEGEAGPAASCYNPSP